MSHIDHIPASFRGEFPDDCKPPKDEQTRTADGDDEPPALEAS